MNIEYNVCTASTTIGVHFCRLSPQMPLQDLANPVLCRRLLPSCWQYYRYKERPYILFAIAIITTFNTLGSDFKMVLSPESVVLAVFCSTLIGVMFGYMPAQNASKLNPITALAQE